MKFPHTSTLISTNAFLSTCAELFRMKFSDISSAALPQGFRFNRGTRVNCGAPKFIPAFPKQKLIRFTHFPAAAAAKNSRTLLPEVEGHLPEAILRAAASNDKLHDVLNPENQSGGGERGERVDNESWYDDNRVLLDEEVHESVEEEPSWEAQAKAGKQLSPGLYLVGTPIGNMEDITLRALRVLRSAACILAEDTRHSAKLLQYHQIRTPMLSYHKFNEHARIKVLIKRLDQGETLALISDAGMPGISDPGFELVKACVDADVQVFPIPGPSASVTALVASGLPTKEFSFVGFLPERPGSRKKRLLDAAKESATQIFFVPPHKLCRVLEDMASAFGPMRRCAVAREMTKLHEEIWRGTLDKAKEHFNARSPRGELTLVVEGVQDDQCAQQVTEEELKHRLKNLLAAGESPSEATRKVVQEGFGKRNLVYALALEISKSPS